MYPLTFIGESGNLDVSKNQTTPALLLLLVWTDHEDLVKKHWLFAKLVIFGPLSYVLLILQPEGHWLGAVQYRGAICWNTAALNISPGLHPPALLLQ